MKRLLFVLLFSIIPSMLCAEIRVRGDIALQYYPPSFWQIASGGNALYSFRDNFEDTKSSNSFLAPLEVKKMLFHFKNSRFVLVGNGWLSFFFVDGKLNSMNTSLGIGINYGSLVDEDSIKPLSGVGFTLYPLYEFAAISFGKTPLFPWKFAFDTGFSFDLMPLVPIYLSAYMRTIGIFLPAVGIAQFKFGVAAGWLF